jgi:hypothetical protein
MTEHQGRRFEVKFKSTNFIKLHSLIAGKHYRASFGKEAKRKKDRLNRLKFSMKVKSLLSIVIVVILLVSVLTFLPKQKPAEPIVPVSTDSPTASPTAVPQSTSQPSQQPDPLSQISRYLSGVGDTIVQAVVPKTPGIIEAAQGMNNAVWRQVAANAWQYFKPDIGVNSTTGLPNSGGNNFPYFTDWDLGVYIQAVIDANATGLINNDGAWGSSARLEKIVKFLETRELNNASYPYWFYQSSDGKNYHAMSDLSTITTIDGSDTGRLFVALNNLRIFNNSLASRINNIVLYGQLYNRSDYQKFVPSILADSQTSTSIYSYYVYSGFASFWPDQLSTVPNKILTNILASGNVTTYNVTLPNASILGDPLLSSVFDLNKNSSQIMYIMRQVYLAHEAYSNATGIYRAFSEGGSLNYHWAYEWVVLPENRTWVILDETFQPLDISPVIYTKVAMGFLAIYNSSYAYNMNVHLEQNLPDQSNGFSEGVNEDGLQLTSTGSNTNGLILSAAKYAIKNNP